VRAQQAGRNHRIGFLGVTSYAQYRNARLTDDRQGGLCGFGNRLATGWFRRTDGH
jgi:hypothetical protein